VFGSGQKDRAEGRSAAMMNGKKLVHRFIVSLIQWRNEEMNQFFHHCGILTSALLFAF
jgi:hypothetical protein